jgi:hypothetical protein
MTIEQDQQPENPSSSSNPPNVLPPEDQQHPPPPPPPSNPPRIHTHTHNHTHKLTNAVTPKVTKTEVDADDKFPMAQAIIAACNGGEDVIDQGMYSWGPQVLQYAHDLRWASVRNLLHLSKSLSSLPLIANNNFPSSSLLSVLGNPDLARYVSLFLLRTDIVVRDPSIPIEPKEPDAVKKRIEASLAAAGSSCSRKRSRKGAVKGVTVKGLN